MTPLSRPARAARIAPLFLLLAACGGSDDDSGENNQLTVRISTLSVAGGVPSDFGGVWAAFLADEATSGAGGMDLNGDGDVIDSVAQQLNLQTGVEANVGVAARDFRWLGDRLYLVVDEAADGVDWDGDTMMDDRVLLEHDPTSMAVPTYLATLPMDTGADILRTDEWIFVRQRDPAVMANTSWVWGLHESLPTTLHQVMTNDAAGGLQPRLLAAHDDLVFLELDETVEGRDLNGDADSTDTSVLALLDGRGMVVMGGYELPLRNTSRAMPANAVVAALSTGMHDWQVGFPVDETGQGAVNLNNPLSGAAMLPGSWEPTQCTGFTDNDTVDQVLSVIAFRAWDDDPVTNPPVNTGLVTTDRIVMVPGYVGVISDESDHGTCDLNGDGDTDDEVFRWTSVTQPILPPSAVSSMFAVSRLSGGLQGVGTLDDAFVMAVSEADDRRDLNDDGFQDLSVVQWLDPSAGVTWTNDHGASQPSYAAASWMGPSSDGTRLGVAYDELSNGVDLNNDGDQLDSMPTFAQFTGAPVRMAFPGYTAAVQKTNAGIVFQNGWAFYRISEAEDDRDWNGDGASNEFVMLRSRIADGLSQFIVTLNSLPIPAVRPDLITGAAGGVFLVDEMMAGDVNGDGVISFALVYYAI